MLDLGRYLLGVGEIALLVGFAALAGSAARSRLLPGWAGAPARLVTAVLALALLIWAAELLGVFGLFEPLPYLAVVAVAGLAIWLGAGGGRGCPSRLLGFSPLSGRLSLSLSRGRDRLPEGWMGWGVGVAAFAVAAIAVVRFALEAGPHLTVGMTGFDSTWYHGPLAAGFFQSGDTWGLHFIAPQFLAWFYPANSELLHAVGMLAFGRDILSPLLNLGWLAGCLLACWCIGRPYGVAPWSLALGAIALSVPAFADQAGEARNDVVGTFFLLAAAAVVLNARSAPLGAPVVAGLAAGLAAGTKLNFLPPAAALAVGLALIAPSGRRWGALAATSLGALAGGGYWYLRNLAHSGNPLPWVKDIGPISLPGPDQALGGREGHSVFGYLTDGAVWADWFLPGLRDGLTILWPLLLALSLAGLLLGGFAAAPSLRRSASRNRGGGEQRGDGGGRDAVLAVVGLTGLATVLAWLLAPTSASGPEGMPRGFESGLRYLVPPLTLGLALFPVVLSPRLRRAGMGCPPNGRILKAPVQLDRRLSGRGTPHARPALALALIAAFAVAIGYPVQRHYLENRYADPTFAAPGLNAAFEWSRSVGDARIATTATRQYPLYGTDLSNHVRFVGEERPHGGFTAPTACPRWRRLLDAGGYDYVVASRDRLEPGKPPYPATAAWTEAPGATALLRVPPTAVYELSSTLAPSTCP